MPVVPPSLWLQVADWIEGWKYARELAGAGLRGAGAMLLHGPTGTGKTTLARGLVNHLGRPARVIDAHDIVEVWMGNSARNLASGFRQAEGMGAFLVIEEIDALGGARTGLVGGGAQEDSRITIALMRLIEAAQFPVVATTNCLGNLDPALVRRFELKLEVPLVEERGRVKILKSILGRDPETSLVALPLVDSVPIAHRMRRREFIDSLKAR